MMYYKTLAARLVRCGWEIKEESHGGDIYPHYFKYRHPADDNRDGSYEIELVCAANKNGAPGRIIKAWQGGRPCRV